MDANSEQATEARARLTAERERLEKTMQEVVAGYRESGGISTLSGDAGADSTQADTDIGLQQDIQHQLDEVDAAFARIDAGTYGIDEVTGEPIEPARLDAIPTARTNID